jgi:hypothetical protein
MITHETHTDTFVYPLMKSLAATRVVGAVKGQPRQGSARVTEGWKGGEVWQSANAKA